MIDSLVSNDSMSIQANRFIVNYQSDGNYMQCLHDNIIGLVDSDKNWKILKYSLLVGSIWIGLGSIMKVGLMTMLLWGLKGLST